MSGPPPQQSSPLTRKSTEPLLEPDTGYTSFHSDSEAFPPSHHSISPHPAPHHSSSDISSAHQPAVVQPTQPLAAEIPHEAPLPQSFPDQPFPELPPHFSDPVPVSEASPSPARLLAPAPYPSPQFYSQPTLYYPSPSDFRPSTMMANRDLGYGYMPSPVPNFLPGHSYGSLSTSMPFYYPEQQSPRNFQGLSRSSFSQPPPSLSSRPLVSSPEDAGRKRKRQASPDELSHETKLRVRKSRLPGMPGSTAEDVHLQSGAVDLFATPPPVSSAYVPEYLEATATSRPPTAPTYQEGYQTSTSPSYSLPQPLPSTYSMAPMSLQALTQPSLPGPQLGYSERRTSPLLHHPLPPVSGVGPALRMTHHPQPHHPHPQVAVDLEPKVLDRREKPRCWDHGCNGREFSTFSNLLRHQREKSGSAAKSYCPHCGAEFTRTTARNGHMEHGKCKNRRQSEASTTGTTRSAP